MNNSKSNMFSLSLVAIVALLGIFFIVTSKTASVPQGISLPDTMEYTTLEFPQNEDLSGEATKKKGPQGITIDTPYLYLSGDYQSTDTSKDKAQETALKNLMSDVEKEISSKITNTVTGMGTFACSSYSLVFVKPGSKTYTVAIENFPQINNKNPVLTFSAFKDGTKVYAEGNLQTKYLPETGSYKAIARLLVYAKFKVNCNKGAKI